MNVSVIREGVNMVKSFLRLPALLLLYIIGIDVVINASSDLTHDSSEITSVSLEATGGSSESYEFSAESGDLIAPIALPVLSARRTRSKSGKLSQPLIFGEVYEVISPLFDKTFKKIFGTTKALTKDFLNASLELEGDDRIATIKSFLPASQYLPIEYGKCYFFFDILCIDKKGRKYVIEIQRETQACFANRIIYYGAVQLVLQAKRLEELDRARQTPGDQASSGADDGPSSASLKAQGLQLIEQYPPIERGSSKEKRSLILYKGLLQVKLLIITNFKMLKGRGNCIEDINLCFMKEPKEVFSKLLSWRIIDLTKFRLKASQLQTNLDCWLYFLSRGRHLKLTETTRLKLSKEMLRKNPMITEAYRRAIYLTPAERRELAGEVKNYHDTLSVIVAAEDKGIAKGKAAGIVEGMEKGRAAGMARGRAEGERAKQLEIARNLKAANVDMKIIMQATKLTEGEISDL